MAGATPSRADSFSFVSKTWRAGLLLAAALILAASYGRTAFAETGEPFVANETPPPAPPLLVREEPAALPPPPPADPPGLEAAHGARLHEALAKRAPPHAVKPARAEPPGAPPKLKLIARPAEPAPPAKPPPVALIQNAEAAESLSDAATPSPWRRLIGSRFAAWIAGIVLIGIPLFGLVWRHVAERRAARDLMEFD